MADKSFGVKDINLIGVSGTPEIESPNNLNINAVNVAISTDISVGGKISIGTGTSISSPASNTLTLGTNSSERLRITSGGQVHVGNATNNAIDNAWFKAVADDGEAADIYVGQFINNEATAGQSYGVNIQAGSNSTDHGFRVKNKANTTTQFLVRGDGNIGINETAPAAELVVKQSGSTFATQSQTVALFQRSSTTGHGAKIAIVSGNAASSDINFGDVDDEDAGLIQYVHTDNYFKFCTNGDTTNEKLRITSDGKLGVGTASPSQILELKTGEPRLCLNGTTANSDKGIEFEHDGSRQGHLFHNPTSGEMSLSVGENTGGAHYLTFKSGNGTEKMRITSAGDAQITDGNLVVASGHGIDFSATSDASGKDNELLDDYEEGSWTPTNSNATITTASGRYIKIGRLVTITARINWASTSNTSTAQIGGLPFAVDDNLSNSAMGGAVGETTYTGSDRPMAAVETSDVIRFRLNGGTSMTNANWSSHSVRFSLTYFAGS